MQINRLSPGLQEELKSASNFNTARNETLFQYQAATAVSSGTTGQKPRSVDFSELDTDDLNITPGQIEDLLAGFSEEIIKVFSSDILLDNPLREQNNGQESGTTTFTA